MEHGDKTGSKSGSAGEITCMQHGGDKKPEASGQAGRMMGGMGCFYLLGKVSSYARRLTRNSSLSVSTLR